MQDDGASILWTTLQSGDGRVVIGKPDGDMFTVSAATRVFQPAVTKLNYTFYQHQADIRGLQPGIEYAYQPTMNGLPMMPGPGFFRAAAPDKFSFLVFGDSGENSPEQRALIALMGAEPGISFLAHTGDLAYPEGSFAEYETDYFGLNAALFERLPVFPTPGNHDYMVNSAGPYLAAHSVPRNGVNPADAGRYYSFDWGDAHFTSLDSNLMPAGAAADRMLAWLENDLSSTSKFWKIVFLHHPPYPTGHHLGDPICAAVGARVNPIVERHGVQLLLAGHEHGYERTAPLSANERVQPGLGTTYVITGGGGAGLHYVNCNGCTDIALGMFNYLRIDVEGGELTVRAKGVDGNEIERFILRPKPVIAEASLAPGLPATIFGLNLAVKQEAAIGEPLPLLLGGVRVQLDGRDIPLRYVSPGQVNVQVPEEATGIGIVQILNENGFCVRGM